MSRKKLQVFVSSTYTDLREERQAAVEAILKAGHLPAGMELFAAGDQSQLDTIRRWIDESDVFMLILGTRYGSIDPNTSLSYIELEYDYAIEKNIPVFAVVINEESIDSKLKQFGRSAIEQERPRELQLFREKILSRICSFFTHPADVKLAVHETLADFVARHSFSGWVRAEDVASVATLVNELSRATQRVRELESEVMELQSRLSDVYRKVGVPTEEELEDLAALLATTNVKHIREGEEWSFSLLEWLFLYRDSLVRGVSNHASAPDWESFLYYNICPKLAVQELAASEGAADKTWRRFALTARGRALLAYLDRKRVQPSPEIAPAKRSKVSKPKRSRVPAPRTTKKKG